MRFECDKEGNFHELQAPVIHEGDLDNLEKLCWGKKYSSDIEIMKNLSKSDKDFFTQHMYTWNKFYHAFIFDLHRKIIREYIESNFTIDIRSVYDLITGYSEYLQFNGMDWNVGGDDFIIPNKFVTNWLAERHKYARIKRNKKVARAFKNWARELWRPPHGRLCQRNVQSAYEMSDLRL